jgi:muramoyltetrapeptide carboxypeptidase
LHYYRASMLTRPRSLHPGDHIAVLAASSPSDFERVREAGAKLEARGFRVSFGSNIDSGFKQGYLAGSDELRASEFNRFLNDLTVDAFFFARGGYGAMRILEGLDYDAMRRNPRPLVGFSDVTALHAAFALHSGVRSFHGPMLNLDFFEGLSAPIESWLWSLLAGESGATWRFGSDQVVIDGVADGRLFGGCLSLHVALTGTPYDFWIDDGIWFFEDVDESLYRIDRMLTHLRLSGRISGIQGVIIGRMKDCGDDERLLALFRDTFGPLGIPVVHNFPFGHHGDNLLMPIGSAVRLDTRSLEFIVTESAVDTAKRVSP